MDNARYGGTVTYDRRGRDAIIVGEYRYSLWDIWDETRPRILWVMLNPSVADKLIDDPTLRQCRGFSKNWRYGGLELVNLFAYRTKDWQCLKNVGDPIGPENNQYIANAARSASAILVAWGERGSLRQRSRKVLDLLARSTNQPLLCLGTVQNGEPRHPLYLPHSTTPVPYGTMA